MKYLEDSHIGVYVIINNYLLTGNVDSKSASFS